jgi:hypothetical protein
VGRLFTILSGCRINNHPPSGSLVSLVLASLHALASLLYVHTDPERTLVGLATFDSSVHFYGLRKGASQAQMLVVPDVADGEVGARGRFNVFVAAQNTWGVGGCRQVEPHNGVPVCPFITSIATYPGRATH